MGHDKIMIPLDKTHTDIVINPDRFGPSLWQGMHYITLGYPENPTKDQMQKYQAFFLLLKDVLPCSVCANHYRENLNKMPLTTYVLEDRERFIKWLIDFHNVVNEMKNKPIIPYDEARKMIDTDMPCVRPVQKKITENFSDTNITTHSNNFLVIFGLAGLLAILLIIAIVYKKK